VNRRSVFAMLVASLITTSLGSHTAFAAAAKAPNIEISIIHALRTDGGGSIDPQLRDLPQLTKQQPFVRYNVFKLLDRKQLPLEKGKPVVYALVDGRTLQVTLADVTDGKNDERYHLRAEIAGPAKKEFLKLLEVTASANEPFFVGGQRYQGGTLFLELVVRT
jgi:hypothetical protein